MTRIGAISAISAAAVLTLFQTGFAESAESLGAGSFLRPAVDMKNGLILEARLPRPLSLNENEALRPMDRFKECESCPEMIVVPAGQFYMGAHETESGSTPDERPQHRVSFAQSFSVGRYAVTFDEWDACLAAMGCSYRPPDQNWGRAKQPVINILWDEAKEYVAWLSR